MNLYPTGSFPRKFYGTAEKHKLAQNGAIDYLPIRASIPNIKTASYKFAKHLTKIISSLSKSAYKHRNNIKFVNRAKSIKIKYY